MNLKDHIAYQITQLQAEANRVTARTTTEILRLEKLLEDVPAELHGVEVNYLTRLHDNLFGRVQIPTCGGGS